eukprot:g17914.t1
MCVAGLQGNRKGTVSGLVQFQQQLDQGGLARACRAKNITPYAKSKLASCGKDWCGGPDGPTKATVSPASTVKFTSSTPANRTS